MYLVGREGGHALQNAIWRLVVNGLRRIHNASAHEVVRMQELMTVFHDTPMDLADASVVAAYESLANSTVFTIDSHFYAYRTSAGSALALVPSSMP